MLKKVLVFAFVIFVINTAEAAKTKPYFLEGCPYIKLKGKVEHWILPGAPNYESISNGDVSSERWFIVPNEESKKYLRESGVFETIPEEFRPIAQDWKENVSSIQIAASGELEKEFEKQDDRELILEGWLGSWDTHSYSLFFFEVATVISD